MSEREQRSSRGRAWRWLWTPRARPKGLWAGLLGLSVVLGLVLTGPRTPMQSSEPAATVSARAAVRVRPVSAGVRQQVLDRALDLWSERTDGDTLDVVLDAAGLAWLRAQAIDFEVLVPDVDAVARVEHERLAAAQVARPTPEQWFTEYRDLETIHGYLDTLAATRPDLVSLETIGSSLQGRPLRALRIHGPGRPRARMLVNGGLHAREWISMMVTTCVADRLVRGYDDDPRLRRFVDEVELTVVPVANPDGYVHSWGRDRYWRKNRRGDHGVDLNRNFGVAWGGNGSSANRRSQVYRGEGPFSEPEAAALRDFVQAEGISAHIDFHSYGQLLLHPWSYTRTRSKDHARLSTFANGMAKAIKAEHGQRYRLMPGESLYPAAGTLMDWVYGDQRAMSFVIELRPRGGSGFVLPPDQIVPTCDEGLAAVLSLGESLR
ncbi:MAG: M14 metallopeptidase family protein [Nannocystaceae bacterium]